MDGPGIVARPVSLSPPTDWGRDKFARPFRGGRRIPNEFKERCPTPFEAPLARGRKPHFDHIRLVTAAPSCGVMVRPSFDIPAVMGASLHFSHDVSWEHFLISFPDITVGT